MKSPISTEIFSRLEKFWYPQASGRVLGLLRIFLGAALLYDALTFVHFRDFLFGVNSVLGPLGSVRHYPTVGGWVEQAFGQSLALDTLGLTLVFSVYFCALCFFTLGYFYRISVICAWLIFYYLNVRNFLIFDSGSSLASMLLLFLMFLPADECFSIKNYLKYRSWENLPGEKIIENAWSLRLIQIQMCIVYLATFLFKLEGSVWYEGTAAYYATRLPVYIRPEVQTIIDFPWLLMAGTYITLAVEGLFPFLVWVQRLRLWVVFGAIFFHLCLDRIFFISAFQWVMISGILSFLTIEDFSYLKSVYHGWRTRLR